MPAITIIDTVPHCVSPHEHADIVSRTPENFNDIPAVLRLKQDDVSVELDPPVPDIPPNTKGTIYVIESVLAFLPPSGKGFQVQYPKITLHAVSRSDAGPSVYCQLDEHPDGTEVAEDEDAEMSELKIYPGSMDAVEAIFEALSHCASLHPDPNAPPEEPDDFDEAFVDADESNIETFSGGQEEELSEVGRAALAHLESIFQRREPLTEEVDEEEEEEEEGEKGEKAHPNGTSSH